MRYIVIGAGAIGGTIGGKLAASGHEVVLVARGPHLDALRAKGLILATPDGTVTLDIPAVAGPGELDLREDKINDRLRELVERETRMEQREQDLAGYVASVQQRFTAA